MMKNYDHKKLEKKCPHEKLSAFHHMGAGFSRGKQKEYNHLVVERKWQKYWQKKKLYQAKDFSKKPKFYGLIEFPYPSGDGLHVGHPRPYIGMDVISRKRRMEGYNVLYPIGWDAFGLPTENYAIKTGVHPAKVTKKNTNNFRRQIKLLAISFDWSREINTTDPKYYKWTQWIFLQLFKKGLAYKAKMPINWCLSCKIGLANEEVIDGKCERCGGPTEKREKEQWMLAITKYADRLDKDLDTVDYLPKIKVQQRNWIGKSEGALIKFPISNFQFPIEVFTTRADTLFGVTYIVLSPENKLVQELKPQISNWDEVVRYIVQVKKKTEIERTDVAKEKTGVELKGVKAVNPANNKEIPIFIADYVLASYGTGAIMAVPAHDQRDFKFAKKFDLSLKWVVHPPLDSLAGSSVLLQGTEGKYYLQQRDGNASVHPHTIGFFGGHREADETAQECIGRELHEELSISRKPADFTFIGVRPNPFESDEKKWIAVFELNDVDPTEIKIKNESTLMTVPNFSQLLRKDIAPSHRGIIDAYNAGQILGVYDGTGVLVNSGNFSGLSSDDAKKKITEFVGGKTVTTYKLRDWVFSRQRYWGEPIPMIHCEKCARLHGQGWIPVPEKDLPVKLPNIKNYKPTDSGESPLASIEKWVNVKCPKCGGKARRETDTMPTWAGSSWYYLAYVMQEISNFQFPISKYQKAFKYWTPVDWYNGGMEHTTLHLLYSRFWHKFLFDQGLVPTSEPYAKRTSHGLILAEGGVKMSKSKGNVVNPDSIVKTYGADTLRIYEMFMGPFDQSVAWSTDSIIGSRRFIERVWNILPKVNKTRDEMSSSAHALVKKVGSDIEEMKFNTAISTMMMFTNELDRQSEVLRGNYETLLKVLAPFAPHITEELWHALGNLPTGKAGKKSIHLEAWPTYDEKLIQSKSVTIAVQINGKFRATFEAPADISEDEVKKLALAHEHVIKWLAGKPPKKVIYVKGRLVSVVSD